MRLAVLNSTYYMEIKHMQFAELVNQITQHVTPSLEPWVKGAHGVPSSLSCIVYRLQEAKIIEKELSYMLASL